MYFIFPAAIPSWKHLITDTTPVTMTTTTPLSVLSSVGRQRTGVTLTNNEDPEVTMKTTNCYSNNQQVIRSTFCT